MARKPITTYAGGKGPRQLIWEAIRTLQRSGQPIVEIDIWQALPREVRHGLDLGAVRDYRRALVAAGILGVVADPTARTNGTYQLLKDEGLEAPRLRRDGSRVTQGLAQEQMWRTLRLLTCDTNHRELAAHASSAAVPVAEAAAKDYLKTLHIAGYLQRTTEGKGTGAGGIQTRYRLKPQRNTGPRPPMICRTKVVYDPNEDKVVWQPKVSEEDAIYGR